MPRAQPTNTDPETSASTDRKAARHAGDGDRDPDTPTTGAEARAKRTGDMAAQDWLEVPEPEGWKPNQPARSGSKVERPQARTCTSGGNGALAERAKRGREH